MCTWTSVCVCVCVYTLGGCGGNTTTTTKLTYFCLAVGPSVVGGNFILIKFLWYVIFFINAFFFGCVLCYAFGYINIWVFLRHPFSRREQSTKKNATCAWNIVGGIVLLWWWLFHVWISASFVLFFVLFLQLRPYLEVRALMWSGE